MNQDEIYPCSEGCTSLSVKEVMSLFKLKQEIIDLIRNENVTDGNYELWEKLQQLLKGDEQ